MYPDIADLSDQNRPTKLGEMYSELYDNEWTDVFEALTAAGHSEETAIKTFGLMLTVPCSNTVCQYINNVPTGKRTNRAWESNTKLSLAIVHAGIGFRLLNSLLSELNIPSVRESSLRARQNQAGSGIENVANESMEVAAGEEMRLTAEKSSTVGLTVSVDGAWQKRGSGRGYDSVSGHYSMIGKETGKVIGCAVRNKYCKSCGTAIRENRTPKPHDCCKIWEGSSKAMEPDKAIDMVSSHSTAGRHIVNIVADDDTTTIVRLRQSVNSNIKKQSDRNHVRKNIISSLHALQMSQKSLSKKVMNYLLKCINYMIQQNQGNSDGISKGFDALSLYPFNDYSLCDSSWCTHLENPSRKCQSLPYGKALTDKALQKSLADLFVRYKRQCTKLSNLGSTQANESFNKTVASKAPKSHFYSGSRNLIHRVAASVAHRNIGHGYITKVNRKIGLSPGWYTNKLATLRDLHARKRKAISTTRTAKRRRLELQSCRYHYNKTQEVREGTS